MSIDVQLMLRLRVKQEEVAQVLNSGYYKTIIEMHAKFFDEYVARGFTREEALEILLYTIQHNAWCLEPEFKGVKGGSDEDTSEEFQK